MDVKAYAESVGPARTTVQDEVRAAKVVEAVTDIRHDLFGSFSQLVEIHAAPQFLWQALVEAMVNGELTVLQEAWRLHVDEHYQRGDGREE